jgi:hypothetical protein
MKSPSGSNFPYYYKNGIIHAIKLGNLKKNEEKFFQLIKAEKEFILNQNTTSTIWIDLYATSLSKKNAYSLVSLLNGLSKKISKCALVGLSLLNRIKIRGLIAHENISNMQIRFYKDPEDAKTWLVGKVF